MRDLSYAARALRRSPGFTVTAIAVLALGIGSIAAIFSVVNKVLLEPLPYPEPDRLVQLVSTSQLGNQNVASIPKYLVWRDNTKVFQDMAAYDVGGAAVNFTQGELSDTLKAARVSANYFRLFGARIALGRTFSSLEDGPNGPPVAVISDRLWRRRFARDLNLVGNAILLDQVPHTVIGVLAPGFIMDPPADIWVPLQPDPASSDHISRVSVVARLKPGVTVEDAQNDVGKTMQPFLRKYAPHSPSESPLIPLENFTAIPLRDAVVGDVRPALYLLIGAVGFVLLISCANVSSLMLARATRRAREFAIRVALGAQRKQVILQLLTESVLLSLAGGVLGLVLGYLGVRELLAVSPGDIPRIGANGSSITLDWRIFLFTFLVSVFTGILFGLIPGVNASRADVSTLAKDNTSQSGMGFRRNRTRPLLVIMEVALALVLLVGAGLLIRTFVAKRTISRGFDEQNVLTLEMSLSSAQFEKTAQVAQLVRNAERRIEHVPSVSAIATTCALPLQPGLTMPFTIFKNDQFLGRYDGASSWRSVSPGYFAVFKIRLLRGRLFTDDDDEQAAGVVLINRGMMKKYWQEVDANPIGEFITIGKGMGPGLEERPRQIIGVVADIREAGLDREPAMYVPAAQVTDEMNARNTRLLPITWVVRTAEAQPAAIVDIQRELLNVSGGRPLGRVRTMHQVIAASSARAQFYMTILAAFAGIALLLATVGLYGLMAYSVQQRTQEIGIRMALGAGPSDVRNMVVLQGLWLALAGIAIGMPAALALARVTVSMIFGIQIWDPAVLALVAILLSIVALVAAWVPSVRATRVNPADALRC
jgi:putative ABC transport system permease protein